MPRKQFVNSSEFPYHLTARCINREWFAIPMSEVWRIMENYLFFIHWEYGIVIHGFVLMINHFHLIASAPRGNISEAMNYFMRETSRAIGRAAGRINQIYGSRFFRSLIESDHYYLHAYKYMYRNPVTAGVASRVEDYPYSTLHGLLGKSRQSIPMCYDDTLFSDFEGTLEWLNEAPEDGDLMAVKTALKRGIFKLPRTKDQQRAHPLNWRRL